MRCLTVDLADLVARGRAVLADPRALVERPHPAPEPAPDPEPDPDPAAVTRGGGSSRG